MSCFLVTVAIYLNFAWIQGSMHHNGTKEKLHLLTLYPIGGTYWPAGLALKAALNLGLKIINERDDILPNHEIVLHYEDSACDLGIGVDSMYRGLYTSPTKILILGPSCSIVCQPTAETSQYWNITQISNGCQSPALSNREKYPRFFRILSTYTATNPIKAQFFHRYKWTSISILVQDLGVLLEMADDLKKILKGYNISVDNYETFAGDPAFEIENLKEKNARIILLDVYEGPALKVFCEAYKQELYGPNIVWFIPNWYSYKWWNKAEEFTDCTSEQLITALEGTILQGLANSNPIEERGVAGLTATEFQDLYANVTEEKWTGLSYGAAAFDCIFAAALALNKTAAYMETNGGKKLHEFDYTDVDITDLIYANIRHVEFLGIQGPIQFGDKGEPDPIITFEQFRRGELFDVGVYIPMPGVTKNEIQVTNGGVEWRTKDGKPPKSSSLTLVYHSVVPDSLYISLCIVAGFGIILAVMFLAFNVYFRKRRVIKMSSPNINNLILIGCIVMYVTVFIQERPDSYGSQFCLMRVLTLTTGFSLIFGALFSKTWRIHVVLTTSTKKFKKVSIKDTQLFGFVAGLVLINAFLVLIWQIIDPFETKWQNITAQVSPSDDDILLQPQILNCHSKYQTYFTSILYGIQGLMLVFGIFLAWETRKVKLEALNDSKLIAMCIYNVVLFSLIGVAINAVLTHQVEAAYGFTSSFLIIATTLTQCIIFIPKVLAVKNDNGKVGITIDIQTVTENTVNS